MQVVVGMVSTSKFGSLESKGLGHRRFFSYKKKLNLRLNSLVIRSLNLSSTQRSFGCCSWLFGGASFLFFLLFYKLCKFF